MEAGTQRKYTDRDVREHPELEEAVHAYLEDYQGEFDYLIDMKMRVASGRELTVGMMRGVLNCMRHDPRVTDLPEPAPIEPGQVIDFPKGNHPRRKVTCDITDFHEAHGGGPNDTFKRCYGKHRYNRPGSYSRPAVVKPRYSWIVAKSGSMIHKLQGTAHVLWIPETHAPGFRTSQWRSKWSSGYLNFQTCCKNPSVIGNGILLTHADKDEIILDRTRLDDYLDWLATLSLVPVPPSQRVPLRLCQRCISE